MYQINHLILIIKRFAKASIKEIIDEKGQNVFIKINILIGKYIMNSSFIK
jgi:hypothetical protein